MNSFTQNETADLSDPNGQPSVRTGKGRGRGTSTITLLPFTFPFFSPLSPPTPPPKISLLRRKLLSNLVRKKIRIIRDYSLDVSASKM